MASTAPAAPRVCPVAPFVDEMGVRRALSSPSASFKTRVSPASPTGVDVPCALTYPISSGVTFALGEGHLQARAGFSPVGSDIGDVVRVRGDAVARNLGMDPSHRVRPACCSSSSTSTAAPSAITNPSRPGVERSRARWQARRSASRARASRPNPAIATAVTGASVPPQNITSARPRRIASTRVADRDVRSSARRRLGEVVDHGSRLLDRHPTGRKVRERLHDRERTDPVGALVVVGGARSPRTYWTPPNAPRDGNADALRVPRDIEAGSLLRLSAPPRRRKAPGQSGPCGGRSCESTYSLRRRVP